MKPDNNASHDLPRGALVNGAETRWWRRIQWIDVVLVIVGVTILLLLTSELWLPHYGPN